MIVRGSEFVAAPDGVHNAICVDVVDLGMQEGAYGPKHMLKIVWEIEAKMDSGKPFLCSRKYGASLHEKSTLHKDLKSWRGKAFTPEELRAFDLEKIVGVPCQLVITHAEKDGAIYANVQTVIKAGATKLTASGGYTRVKDRPPEQQMGAGNGAKREPGQDGGEEGIPF